MLHVVDQFSGLTWEERDHRASVAGALVSMVSLVVSVVAGVVAAVQGRRPATGGQEVAPSVAGRRREPGPWPRMKALTARAARVHEAVPLPAGHPVRPRRRRSRRSAETVLDPELPLFVPRDLSAQVADWMRRARTTGGFLLLVGDSSVGKTRLLFDTARNELADFRVLVPDLGDGAAVNALADRSLSEPVVVWLDELQRFLPGPYYTPDTTAGHTPLTAGAVRRLLDNATPVILLATLWPDHLDHLRATDTVEGVTRPRHPGASDILALRSTQLRVATFNSAEQQRARELGEHDPRLALAATGTTGFNVTETLAGAPRIMQRYREAPATRQAVVHAAVDARRMGIQSPLTPALLRDAARGYLTDIHPDNTWFDQALAELQRHDRREDVATAPLVAIPTADHRDILGYTVTDYLLQELLRERRSARLTDTTWNALARHTHNTDRLELAHHAESRGQLHHALHLYRELADTGDDTASYWLAELLVEQGMVDELRARVDAGDYDAVTQLVVLLVEQGEVAQALSLLRPFADAGKKSAAMELAELLAQQEMVDELRARADAGHDFGYAATQLANLLAKYGEVDELRARADAGNLTAAERLAELLAKQGEVDELRARADAGNRAAAEWLAELLAKRGEVDQALSLLRRLTDTGGYSAAMQLADLLAEQGMVEELRSRADAGDYFAAMQLAELLAEQGMVDELRSRADAGDDNAAMQLADLLADQGMVKELRARADAGDYYAAMQLAELLTGQGEVGQALSFVRPFADAGDYVAADRLAELLAQQGMVEELRARADAGDGYAAGRLAEFLADRGERELLENELLAGNSRARELLIEGLREAGRQEDADGPS